MERDGRVGSAYCLPCLPRELQRRILAFADIDTRRSLGVYARLRVPQWLRDKLNALPRPCPMDVIVVGASQDQVFMKCGKTTFVLNRQIHHGDLIGDHVCILVDTGGDRRRMTDLWCRLPDTGAWEQMTGVLEALRNTAL